MTFQGFKLNAKECSFYGTYKCGVCECDDSHFGRKCECDSDNAHGTKDLTSGCRPDNFTQVDCSGRGSCVCGVCECEGRQNPDEVCSNFLQPDIFRNFIFISSTSLGLSVSATTSLATVTMAFCALAPTTAHARAVSANAQLVGLASLASARPRVTPAFPLAVEKSALARALASAAFASVSKTLNREDTLADTARSVP